MHHPSTVAHDARQAGPAALAQALQASRADTLARFAEVQAALGDPLLRVPCDPALNLPLWELGHIGWFQDWWIGRNPQRGRGTAADPQARRSPPPPPWPEHADALYDSSQVPHASRWQLPLPDAGSTRAQLQASLSLTLDHLAALPPDADDTALYFHRLVLFHEDMHHEAALYMAQALGIPLADPRWQARRLPPPGAPLALPGGPVRLGWDGPGFAFDNECPPQPVQAAALEIDAQVLRWAEFLPFVDDGGYREPRWWTAEGLQWLATQGPGPAQGGPRYLRRAAGTGPSTSTSTGTSTGAHRSTDTSGLAVAGSGWEHWRHGRWQPLDPALPACHLSLHEALAWCAWAGRRLPTEAEWQQAADQAGTAFVWGDVWEWTASAFAPYPGFVPHPYRDYSKPWFDGRPVLRGSSFTTQPRLRSRHYRNYFPGGRNDIYAGFRTCRR